MAPEVKVSPEQWKVAVINGFDPAALDINRQGKAQAIAEGAYHAYEGVLHAVENDDSFVLVHEDSLFQGVTGDLQPQHVQDLYMRHPHHLLLVLENFNVSFDKEVERVQDENQEVEKIAHYTLQTTATWAMFDSTGLLLDRSTITRQEPYDSRTVISGLLAIGPSYANAIETVNALSHQIGAAYWSRLYPRSGTFTRTLYTNSALSPAVLLMHQRHWDEAIEHLQPLTTSESKSLSGKAAHNLAVAYEQKGKLEEAKKWAVFAKARGAKLANQLLLMYK
ncbi:hypothetical protein CA264_07765 [Pontibacter actiniarum]|uniref:Tetratricopeptide repeat protein n=2 Tax=Pontibacter actiniarum TaxID=323450 RepID=A0A1X9YR46_9BACT|nr:hypothetical protein CA264_07765 [Pontibacter actiniarum]